MDYEWKESSGEWVTNTNDYTFDGETYVYTDKKTSNTLNLVELIVIIINRLPLHGVFRNRELKKQKF